MGIEEAPNSSAAKVIILRGLALGFVVIFVLVSVFVLASLYVARTRAMQVRAIEERALAEKRTEVQLRQQAEQIREQQSSDSLRKDAAKGVQHDIAANRKFISVKLDADGNVDASGQASSLDQLRDLIESTDIRPNISLAVILYVDRRCPFERVVRVQGLCEELGVGVARIQSRQETGAAGTPSRVQTAANGG